MIESHARFAGYVATLGRGPGRSRALTREEAQDAFGMVLRGEADPHQVGAFLMLLRFRGEDAEEITGIVRAAREDIARAAREDIVRAAREDIVRAARESVLRAAWDHGPLAPLGSADLDWPSYGAGRTRGAPWYLLSALALARAGVRVLMHGANDFSAGIGVEEGLAALGMAAATDPASALATDRFAYVPLRLMSPALYRLLEMRSLFGLRSPVNTACRLLNPADAPYGVDGVFHPPYIEVHLGVAERMGRQRLLVLKGGGGEAERVPLKPVGVALWDSRIGRSEFTLPAVAGLQPHPPAGDTPSLLAAVWHGEAKPETPLATVQATIALVLLAMERAADPSQAMHDAATIWRQRR